LIKEIQNVHRVLLDCIKNKIHGKYTQMLAKWFNTVDLVLFFLIPLFSLPYRANAKCKTCTIGTEFTSLSTVCETCGTGKYQPENNVASVVCTACPSGYINPEQQQSRCTSCMEGKYAGAEGSTECGACGSGTAAANSSASRCTDCVAGRYQEEPLSIVYQCKVCPNGCK